MTTTTTAGDAARRVLVARGLTKRFGAVRALTDADLEVHAGEVVALVGDNGAGKSTLVNALSGVVPPDSGTVEVDSRPVTVPTPRHARDLGIAAVYQELALVEPLDVVRNLWLGREPTRFGFIDEVEMEYRTAELLRDLKVRIGSPRTPVAQLSGGQRQAVAIARSLVGDPRILILDEPTAALSVSQTVEVLNLVERVRERGIGVVLVSHNIADVLAVSDRVVVLRLGRNNGVFRSSEVTSETIIGAITGAITPEPDRRPVPPPASIWPVGRRS